MFQCAGAFEQSLPIPLDLSLYGQLLNLQAWYLPAGTLPAVTSNGQRLMLGD